MAWARLYHKYSLQQWARVIWSDEAYIYLGDDRGRVFVTRRPDEEYLDECLVPTFKQSPVRVMVWACIMKGRKGPLSVAFQVPVLVVSAWRLVVFNLYQ
jgi:hypothetical protein